MPARVFVSKKFDKWATNEKVSDADLLHTSTEIEDGLIDASLGGGVVKKRLARQGGSKAGGYRTIVFFYEKVGDRLVFAAAFPKNVQGNIGDKALRVFKMLAKIVLAFDDVQMQKAVDDGTYREIPRPSHTVALTDQLQGEEDEEL